MTIAPTLINRDLRILVSVLAAKTLASEAGSTLKKNLMNSPDVAVAALAIAQTFDQPELTRSLNLARLDKADNISLKLDFQSTQVSYQGQVVGHTKILFKSPLPGELQARLAIESTIDRFLEYLQKVHQVVVLDESDRHVQLFIPKRSDQSPLNFEQAWKHFLEKVVFSIYGLQKHQLPGLAQTFISMLRSIKLSDRGFSTLEVPILSREQANVLAAWYFAVWRETKKRQDDRQKKILALTAELENPDLLDKERKTKIKQVQDEKAVQLKEASKYKENFQKLAGKLFEEHSKAYQQLNFIDSQLRNESLPKSEVKKLQKQQNKLREGLTFAAESIQNKLDLINASDGDPIQFIELDMNKNFDKFKDIVAIAKTFDKTTTDQIAGVKGAIFAKCILEIYRLLEMTDDQFNPLPAPLLTEQVVFQARSQGDDSKEFCYSCGVLLDPKTAKWQVRRLIFESPEQRRQSASCEGRPHICASCAALALASPLKLSGESIILKLEPTVDKDKGKLRLKDYLRMLTSKELHLSAGKYIVLASDKTRKGDSATQKLGQVQYALAKVASIFPLEVLSDFQFSLMVQSSKPIRLENRHLIFIKGLMENYGQSIILDGKDINSTLGNAIRYIQQDLPSLADYTITKIANTANNLALEKTRLLYWQTIQADLNLQGDHMDSDTHLAKRARLYRDVAALTGLTLAFATALESTARKAMGNDDAEREVSKLIEKVDDAVAFCYYATLGDKTKTSVQARLWRNADNEFIYTQTKALLSDMGISDREEQGEDGSAWLTLYADDVLRAIPTLPRRKITVRKKTGRS